jgi:hypothetical protein
MRILPSLIPSSRFTTTCNTASRKDSSFGPDFDSGLDSEFDSDLGSGFAPPSDSLLDIDAVARAGALDAMRLVKRQRARKHAFVIVPLDVRTLQIESFGVVIQGFCEDILAVEPVDLVEPARTSYLFSAVLACSCFIITSSAR